MRHPVPMFAFCRQFRFFKASKCYPPTGTEQEPGRPGFRLPEASDSEIPDPRLPLPRGRCQQARHHRGEEDWDTVIIGYCDTVGERIECQNGRLEPRYANNVQYLRCIWDYDQMFRMLCGVGQTQHFSAATKSRDTPRILYFCKSPRCLICLCT